jgi:hypothetical protein
MNHHQLCLLTITILLMAGQAIGQDESGMENLDHKIERHLHSKMPGWDYRSGEPIQGSKGVRIQTWTISNRGIRIAMTCSKSAAEAKEHIQNFMKEVKGEPLEGFGDNAFLWGFDGSDLEVRRGRCIFDLNAGADVLRDADASTLTPSERNARAKSEVRRILTTFAKHVVDAVDAP